jgi:hypothetical protein
MARKMGVKMKSMLAVLIFLTSTSFAQEGALITKCRSADGEIVREKIVDSMGTMLTWTIQTASGFNFQVSNTPDKKEITNEFKASPKVIKEDMVNGETYFLAETELEGEKVVSDGEIMTYKISLGSKGLILCRRYHEKVDVLNSPSKL